MVIFFLFEYLKTFFNLTRISFYYFQSLQVYLIFLVFSIEYNNWKREIKTIKLNKQLYLYKYINLVYNFFQVI